MTTAQAPLRQSLGAVMKQTFEVEPGTPPEFAQYLRTIASDRLVALAAWKDVREKAVRLRRDSQVHVEVYKPEVITARVEGDHGVYYTTVQRLGAYPGGPSRLRESSISGWSCECEWGHWAWIRKRTFVGRMCSHALALTYEMQSRDHSRRRDRGRPIRVRQGPSTPGGQGGTRTRMTLSSANRKMWTRQSSTNWVFVTDDPYHPTAVISRTASGFKAFVYPDGLSQFSLALGTFKNSEGARRAIGRVINSAGGHGPGGLFDSDDHYNKWLDETLNPSNQDDYTTERSPRGYGETHPPTGFGAPHEQMPDFGRGVHGEDPGIARQVNRRRDLDASDWEQSGRFDPSYMGDGTADGRDDDFGYERERPHYEPSIERNWNPPAGLESHTPHDWLEGVQPGSKMYLTYHDLANQSHRDEEAIFHGITGEGDNKYAHFTSQDERGEPYTWQAYQYAATPDELDDMSDEDEEPDEQDEGYSDWNPEEDNPNLGRYRQNLHEWREGLGHLYNGRPRWSFGSGADPLEGHVTGAPDPGYTQPTLRHEGSAKFADDEHKTYGRPVTEEDEEREEGVRRQRPVVGKYGERFYSSRPVKTSHSPYLSDYTHGYDSEGNSLAPEDSIDDQVTDGQDEITGMMDPQEVLSDGGRVDRSTAPQVTSSFWAFADEKVEGVDDENLRDQPGPSDLFIADEKTLGDAPFIEDFDRGPDAQDFWGGEDFQSEQRAASVTLPGGKKINPTHPLAHRPKHGGQSITRQAGKDYSMAEQQALVDEPGVARNASQLNLQGTHYSQLSEEDTSINFL